MIMQDKLEKERMDAKNAVEEYVYEMRSKISESLSDYITEAVSIEMCGSKSRCRHGLCVMCIQRM